MRPISAKRAVTADSSVTSSLTSLTVPAAGGAARAAAKRRATPTTPAPAPASARATGRPQAARRPGHHRGQSGEARHGWSVQVCRRVRQFRRLDPCRNAPYTAGVKARVVIGVLLVAAAVAAFFLLRKPAPTTVAVADAGSATASKPPERPITEKPPGDDSAGGGPATEQRIDVEDDPPGKLSLEGQVIDSRSCRWAARWSRCRRTRRAPPSPRPTARSRSKSWSAAPTTVAARKDDLHGGPVTVRLTAKTEPVVVRVAPAGGLEVTAVDFETRKPIAGADIEVDAELGIGGTTGADGKATLRGVPAGFQEVVARADGYAPSMSFAEVAGKEGVIDKHTVELKAGAGVSGKVVDPNGKPVAGAEVRADSASGFFDMPRGKKDRVRTDGSGNWSFPALPAGTFRFVARHDKHGPGTSAPLTLDGKNARKDVTIRLEEGGRIAGKVVRKSGEPVPAAAVRVVVADRGFTFDVTRQAFTDDKGAFDIGGLPRRPVEVAAFAEGRIVGDGAGRPRGQARAARGHPHRRRRGDDRRHGGQRQG
jgi:hypothetical protein